MKYYAELLRNLNYISLSIESDNQIPLEIQQFSKNQLTICSPGSISQTVQLPSELGDKISRISVISNPIRLRPKLKSTEAVSTWSSSQLAAPPVCKCGASLALASKWKRLPSEHWAELMDLWHCHKPSTGQTSSGIYALAMNGFHPKPGLAYYSQTYYLVHIDDVVASSHSPGCSISARAAGSDLELKIWKWELSPSGAVAPTMCLMIRELVDAHAVFTFTINSELIIWVLNVSTDFTYTGVQEPLDGVKVLYGDAKKLSSQRPDAEPIQLPDNAYARLTNDLDEINRMLPSNVRSLGPWKLGLLASP